MSRLAASTALCCILAGSLAGQSIRATRDAVRPARPKVGIVLSGGGGKGLSQIGVLKALVRGGVPIDMIVGVSFGSVVGGLYAAGYAPARIESIAVATDWEELLSFSEETKRTDLFVEQREMYPVGYLVLRFDGLEPILPSSISGGQRLSNFFSYLALQAPYHPHNSFDDLKIPFRAVATDLLSGRRIVLSDGSLAEAMRASVTVPLLYAPLERDSLILVDGGLVSNIPVDVAKDLGCTVVVAVNTTGSPRSEAQLKAPWEVADQIMTIMMQESNERQLELADVVITPETGRRIASDFSHPDSLIAAGEKAAEAVVPRILELLAQSVTETANPSDSVRNGTNGEATELEGGAVETGKAGEAGEAGEAGKAGKDGADAADPMIVPQAVRFEGNHLLADSLITGAIGGSTGPEPADDVRIRVVDLYRRHGYSLASIAASDPAEPAFTIDEGRVADVRFEGNERTKDYVLRREFPIEAGDVFTIELAQQGLKNIKSTGLFDYVLLEIVYEPAGPAVVIRVNERSAELLQLGVRADEAFGFIGAVNVRDANFRGAWEDLGLVARYGELYRMIAGNYTVHRLFNGYFTFGLKGYLGSRDLSYYADDTTSPAGSFERIETGIYRERKDGFSVSLGAHLLRLGDVSATLRLEKQQISGVSGISIPAEEYDFVSLKFQTLADTKNKFLFPTEGTLLSLSYESASRSLGSDVGFVKIAVGYESYFSFLERHTLVPRLNFGYADETLPTPEQFTLGGMESFFGLHQNDSRGRQLFTMSLEYRFWLPFSLLFETHLRARYDVGTISLVPEEITWAQFKHGVGIELSLDTPLGEASVGAGKSFYFIKELPDSPITTGPVLYYFTIGPRF